MGTLDLESESPLDYQGLGMLPTRDA